jgi:hypothetical protein
MANDTTRRFQRPLDPVDRVSEILFGLIMVMTSTNALSVITAGRAETRTMIIGALGCNIAWGIIDAGIYLMGCLDDRARVFLTYRAVREAATAEEGRRAIAEAFPDSLTSVLSPDDLEPIRQRLSRLPQAPDRPRLSMEDMLGALGVAVLVILSTFPVVLPFLFVGDVGLALRISNAIGIALLFLCGYVFALATGTRPWPMGLTMIAIGGALVGIAIALGG